MEARGDGGRGAPDAAAQTPVREPDRGGGKRQRASPSGSDGDEDAGADFAALMRARTHSPGGGAAPAHPGAPPEGAGFRSGRCLWVWVPDGDSGARGVLGMALCHTFGALSERSLEWCGEVCDCVSRCRLLRTYVLTSSSVRRCGLPAEIILGRLDALCASPVPRSLREGIGRAAAAGIASVIYGLPEGARIDGAARDVQRLHEISTALADSAPQAGALPPSALEWLPAHPGGLSAPLSFWADPAQWPRAPRGAGGGSPAAGGPPAAAPRPDAAPPADSVFAAPPPAEPGPFPDDEDGGDAEEPPAKRARGGADAASPAPGGAAAAPEPAGAAAAAAAADAWLDDDSDSSSLFSWERPAQFQRRIPRLKLDAAACVALAACAAVAAAARCAFYLPSEECVALLRERAAQWGFPLPREWHLSELRRPPQALRFPVFSPRTPRWALTAARPHQRQALDRIFAGGRLRSGVVCLPCGAGKTMVGVLAAAAASAPCVVLCSGGVAVEQWAAQFARWADLHSTDGRIARVTGRSKDPVTDATQVVLTTYGMLVPRPRRRAESVVSQLKQRHWGLCVADEVHMLPADSCSAVLRALKVRAIVGLTATLVREDDRIQLLEQLIGPRLFEADWQDLAREGVLARAACRELRCAMSAEFAAEHRAAARRSPALAALLAALCPSKLRCVAELVRWHEARGDKTLVFADSLFVLGTLSQLLRRPAVCGATPLPERLRQLSDFQQGRRVNTLVISRIGDCAIDLPAASVIIQVTAHFGSRRQEAQRMGRILRPKGSLVAPAPCALNRGRAEVPGIALDYDDCEAPNAVFYSLVTQDSAEVGYARRRCAYLEDQGYQYRISRYRDTGAEGLPLDTPRARVDLLASALAHWRASRGADDDRERRRVDEELGSDQEGDGDSPLQPRGAARGSPDGGNSPPGAAPAAGAAAAAAEAPEPQPPPALRVERSLHDLSLPEGDLVYGEWELPEDVAVR